MNFFRINKNFSALQNTRNEKVRNFKKNLKNRKKTLAICADICYIR